MTCGNNLPFGQKVIFNIFSKFCVRNLFPRLTTGHWWLPQSCWWDCTLSTSAPTPGKWEIHLNALLYSPASETRSHYRAIVPHGQTGLNLWRHIHFCLAFVQIMNQLVSCSGNLMEKSVNSSVFPSLERNTKQGRAWPHFSERLLII